MLRQVEGLLLGVHKPTNMNPNLRTHPRVCLSPPLSICTSLHGYAFFICSRQTEEEDRLERHVEFSHVEFYHPGYSTRDLVMPRGTCM